MMLSSRDIRTPSAHESIYGERMKMSLDDKLFFLPQVPDGGVVLDYGCGPGDTALRMRALRPDILVIGYDRSSERIVESLRKVPESLGFDNEMSAVSCAVEQMRDRGRRGLMLMSSVAHEIVSFMGEGELTRVMSLSNLFDMIAYRDMGMPNAADAEPDCAPDNISEEMLRSFERRWGRVDNSKKASHLILKSRYPDNWDAENSENYMSVPHEMAIGLLSSFGHSEVLSSHETPEFLQREAQELYGRGHKFPTHIKFLGSKI